MRDKIETQLRILGFNEAEMKVERDMEMMRLNNKRNRVVFKEVKRICLLQIYT